MKRETWKTIGRATYRFLPHNGQFPWPRCGCTITDPQQALLWAKAAKTITWPTSAAPCFRPFARVMAAASVWQPAAWGAAIKGTPGEVVRKQIERDKKELGATWA